MTHRIARFLIPAALAFGLSAQTPVPSAPAGAAPAAVPAPQEPQAPRIHLEFAGGTLADLLVDLCKVEPGLNLVGSALCSEVVVPRLSMTDVTVFALLRAVAQVADPEYVVKVDMESRNGGSPIYSIVAERRSRPVGPPGRQISGPGATPRIAVFTLAKLTDGGGDPAIAIKPETILSALTAGTQGTPLKAPSLRYHQESGLLFAFGDEEQLQYVQQVLRNLEDGQSAKWKRREVAKPGKDAGKDTAKEPEKESR